MFRDGLHFVPLCRRAVPIQDVLVDPDRSHVRLDPGQISRGSSGAVPCRPVYVVRLIFENLQMYTNGCLGKNYTRYCKTWCKQLTASPTDTRPIWF